MSKLFDLREDDLDSVSEDLGEDIMEGVYPKKLRVDGYDVNHYYDGDIPVYEIKDKAGSVINIAHSTSEMHEFTAGREDDDSNDQ